LNGVGGGGVGAVAARRAAAARCTFNWFQVVLTFLCLATLLFHLFGGAGSASASTTASAASAASVSPKDILGPPKEGTASPPVAGEIDSVVTVILLLIRYALYVFLLVSSSTRTCKMQGCCHKKEDWDVPVYEGGSIWDQ
jgi:hypothetical protein